MISLVSKNIVALFFVLMTATAAYAQGGPHTVSGEILGRAGIYSINYDHKIQPNLALGAGFSATSVGSVSVLVLPLYVNYYPTVAKHSGFITGGFDIITASVKGSGGTSAFGSGFVFTAGGGYQLQTDTGFVLRVAGYLLVGSGVAFWPGISLGGSF